jgi:hypothetical protein
MRIRIQKWFLIPLLLWAHAGFGQAERQKIDTSYISDLSKDLTLRAYTSWKYNGFKLRDPDRGKFYLRPNTGKNLGIGANYKFLGINLGFRLPFFNKQDDVLDRSKFLDLQSHLYLRKWAIDFYGQFYKGFYQAYQFSYLPYKEKDGLIQNRPDIHHTNIGLSVNYIFNNQRFSYRAAFLQNEWQKKSAGTFLLGAEGNYFRLKADSSIIPLAYVPQNFANGETFQSLRGGYVASSIGYAYTLVIAKQFFVMASLSGGPGINYMKFANNSGQIEDGIQLQWNRNVRVSAGYNSERIFVGAHFVDMGTYSKYPVEALRGEFLAGNLRMSAAYRLGLKKPLFKRF